MNLLILLNISTSHVIINTKAFWNNIRIWITTITDINIDFTILEVLLGILQENIHSVLCNYMILHAKSYIYNCKNKQKGLSTIEFLRKLKYSLHIY